eukprot:Nk52_evm22s160 gene=Nk52_evmTU22s160
MTQGDTDGAVDQDEAGLVREGERREEIQGKRTRIRRGTGSGGGGGGRNSCDSVCSSTTRGCVEAVEGGGVEIEGLARGSLCQSGKMDSDCSDGDYYRGVEGGRRGRRGRRGRERGLRRRRGRIEKDEEEEVSDWSFSGADYDSKEEEEEEEEEEECVVCLICLQTIDKEESVFVHGMKHYRLYLRMERKDGEQSLSGMSPLVHRDPWQLFVSRMCFHLDTQKNITALSAHGRRILELIDREYGDEEATGGDVEGKRKRSGRKISFMYCKVVRGYECEVCREYPHRFKVMLTEEGVQKHLNGYGHRERLRELSRGTSNHLERMNLTPQQKPFVVGAFVNSFGRVAQVQGRAGVLELLHQTMSEIEQDLDERNHLYCFAAPCNGIDPVCRGCEITCILPSAAVDVDRKMSLMSNEEMVDGLPKEKVQRSYGHAIGDDVAAADDDDNERVLCLICLDTIDENESVFIHGMKHHRIYSHMSRKDREKSLSGMAPLVHREPWQLFVSRMCFHLDEERNITALSAHGKRILELVDREYSDTISGGEEVEYNRKRKKKKTTFIYCKAIFAFECNLCTEYPYRFKLMTSEESLERHVKGNGHWERLLELQQHEGSSNSEIVERMSAEPQMKPFVVGVEASAFGKVAQKQGRTGVLKLLHQTMNDVEQDPDERNRLYCFAAPCNGIDPVCQGCLTACILPSPKVIVERRSSVTNDREANSEETKKDKGVMKGDGEKEDLRSALAEDLRSALSGLSVVKKEEEDDNMKPSEGTIEEERKTDLRTMKQKAEELCNKIVTLVKQQEEGNDNEKDRDHGDEKLISSNEKQDANLMKEMESKIENMFKKIQALENKFENEKKYVVEEGQGEHQNELPTEMESKGKGSAADSRDSLRSGEVTSSQDLRVSDRRSKRKEIENEKKKEREEEVNLEYEEEISPNEREVNLCLICMQEIGENESLYYHGMKHYNLYKTFHKRGLRPSYRGLAPLAHLAPEKLFVSRLCFHKNINNKAGVVTLSGHGKYILDVLDRYASGKENAVVKNLIICDVARRYRCFVCKHQSGHSVISDSRNNLEAHLKKRGHLEAVRALPDSRTADKLEQMTLRHGLQGELYVSGVRAFRLSKSSANGKKFLMEIHDILEESEKEPNPKNSDWYYVANCSRSLRCAGCELREENNRIWERKKQTSDLRRTLRDTRESSIATVPSDCEYDRCIESRLGSRKGVGRSSIRARSLSPECDNRKNILDLRRSDLFKHKSASLTDIPSRTVILSSPQASPPVSPSVLSRLGSPLSTGFAGSRRIVPSEEDADAVDYEGAHSSALSELEMTKKQKRLERFKNEEQNFKQKGSADSVSNVIVGGCKRKEFEGQGSSSKALDPKSSSQVIISDVKPASDGKPPTSGQRLLRSETTAEDDEKTLWKEIDQENGQGDALQKDVQISGEVYPDVKGVPLDQDMGGKTLKEKESISEPRKVDELDAEKDNPLGMEEEKSRFEEDRESRLDEKIAEENREDEVKASEDVEKQMGGGDRDSDLEESTQAQMNAIPIVANVVDAAESFLASPPPFSDDFSELNESASVKTAVRSITVSGSGNVQLKESTQPDQSSTISSNVWKEEEVHIEPTHSSDTGFTASSETSNLPADSSSKSANAPLETSKAPLADVSKQEGGAGDMHSLPPPPAHGEPTSASDCRVNVDQQEKFKQDIAETSSNHVEQKVSPTGSKSSSSRDGKKTPDFHPSRLQLLKEPADPTHPAPLMPTKRTSVDFDRVSPPAFIGEPPSRTQSRKGSTPASSNSVSQDENANNHHRSSDQGKKKTPFIHPSRLKMLSEPVESSSTEDYPVPGSSGSSFANNDTGEHVLPPLPSAMPVRGKTSTSSSNNVSEDEKSNHLKRRSSSDQSLHGPAKKKPFIHPSRLEMMKTLDVDKESENESGPPHRSYEGSTSAVHSKQPDPEPEALKCDFPAVPLVFQSAEQHFTRSTYVIAVTGFTRSERELFIRPIVEQILLGRYTSTLSSENTHLIVSLSHRRKMEAEQRRAKRRRLEQFHGGRSHDRGDESSGEGSTSGEEGPGVDAAWKHKLRKAQEKNIWCVTIEWLTAMQEFVENVRKGDKVPQPFERDYCVDEVDYADLIPSSNVQSWKCHRPVMDPRMRSFAEQCDAHLSAIMETHRKKWNDLVEQGQALQLEFSGKMKKQVELFEKRKETMRQGFEETRGLIYEQAKRKLEEGVVVETDMVGGRMFFATAKGIQWEKKKT